MADEVYHYEVIGLDKVIRDIGQLAEPPDFHQIGALEQVLAAQFADTQERVHIITGSLKLSGQPSSTYDGDVWHGKIKYGGESSGVNNPVTYAIYELARHGTHDFYAGVYGQDFNEAYEEAIRTIFHRADGDV